MDPNAFHTVSVMSLQKVLLPDVNFESFMADLHKVSVIVLLGKQRTHACYKSNYEII